MVDYYKKPLFGIFDTVDDKNWKRYENEKGFLEFISPIDGHDFSSGGADVYIRHVPFYNDVEFIQVRALAEDAEPVFFFFLKHGSEYVQLKGAADVIHEMNEDAELCITVDTVFDYLKFFCLFTVAEDGATFYVIDGQDCEFLSEMSSYEKSRHLRKFNGSIVEDAKEMGVYKITTRVLSEGVLYNCQFDVTADGYVEMITDDYVGSV